jgi:chromosomal replication initiator protein
MQAWEQFLEQQKGELGAAVVKKWLVPLTVVRYDAANLYLEAKDHFQALWFEEHVRKKAEAELKNNNNRKIKIHLSIAGSAPKVPKPRRKRGAPSQEETPPTFELQFDELDPLLIFDNYLSIHDNLIAYKLLTEVVNNMTSCPVQQPSDKEIISFNPIYLHGLSGSGKSHLLMSAAAALRSAGINAIYCRSDTFTSHVVSAIRAGEMSLFRQTYRNADVLVIDDVHNFSKKGATQEELFHTFNALHLEGKQILLSANCPPSELQHIEPRLVSRFEWGIVLPLQPPQGQDLRSALERKLAAFDLKLPKKSVEAIQQHFRPNLKSYARAVQALILRTHLSEEPVASMQITPQSLKELLKDLISEEKKAEVTPDRICWTVADMYGITVEDIKGKSQKRDTALPRQISMFLCRDKLKMAYAKIGDHFERDHSTVMTSIKKIEEQLSEGNQELISALSSLSHKLDGN